MFGSLGWQELALLLLIVLVLFGAGRVAVVMRDLGKGVRAFREEISKKPETEEEEEKKPTGA